MEITEDNKDNMVNKDIGNQTKMYEYITTIIHIFIGGFVLSVIYLCLTNDFVFFTWHPLLLATGWFLLMTEGILMLTSNNPLTKGLSLSHRLKVQCHWIMQAVGVSFSVIGFIVIYINKNLKEKPHFHSWHGIMGLASVVCCIPACVSGVIALYSIVLKNYMTPTNNKFVHRTCGVATFLVGSITVLLSVYTMWMQRNTSDSVRLMWFVIIVFVSLWAISQAVTKVFVKFKSILY